MEAMEVVLSRESINQLALALAEIRSMPEPMVNIVSLADRIGVPISTIRKWRYNSKRNKMPYYKEGGELRFVVSEIYSWMRKGGDN
jgi:hypothetical protein